MINTYPVYQSPFGDQLFKNIELFGKPKKPNFDSVVIFAITLFIIIWIMTKF